MTVTSEYLARQIAGARRFASYDRSDPFTLARCMAHIRQGLCDPVWDPSNRELRDIYYEADPTTEARFYVMDGRRVDFTIPTFKNVRRP